MGTITAANAIYTLAVSRVFPIPQQLAGYSTEAAFDTEASEPAEVVIGVDGILSAGFVPFLTTQTIHLQADSLSNVMFETWNAAQKASFEIFLAQGSISMPSIQRQWTLTNGVLRSFVPIPSAHKVLQPRDYTIVWGSIDPAPYIL